MQRKSSTANFDFFTVKSTFNCTLKQGVVYGNKERTFLKLKHAKYNQKLITFEILYNVRRNFTNV